MAIFNVLNVLRPRLAIRLPRQMRQSTFIGKYTIVMTTICYLWCGWRIDWFDVAAAAAVIVAFHPEHCYKEQNGTCELQKIGLVFDATGVASDIDCS